MNEDRLTVDNLSVAPDQKLFGYEEVTVSGATLRFGLFLINGAQPGPTLVVTAGVHAAEYASIAAALDLGRRLQPDGLRGRVIILPVVNAAGFGPRAIYVNPLDGKNLNRVFPGSPSGTASEQIAHWVFENVIRQADYYVDLHGGDLVEALVPFTVYFRSGDDAVDKTAFEMAEYFGIPYILSSETPGSAYAAAARAGIPAILTEAGGQGIWEPRDVGWHSDGLNRLLRHLGMIDGLPPEPSGAVILKRSVWLRSEHNGFWYPGLPVNAEVTTGQLIGEVMDAEGNVLQDVVAPVDGRVLFIVTSLAINAGDPLLSVAA